MNIKYRNDQNLEAPLKINYQNAEKAWNHQEY